MERKPISVVEHTQKVIDYLYPIEKVAYEEAFDTQVNEDDLVATLDDMVANKRDNSIFFSLVALKYSTQSYRKKKDMVEGMKALLDAVINNDHDVMKKFMTERNLCDGNCDNCKGDCNESPN